MKNGLPTHAGPLPSMTGEASRKVDSGTDRRGKIGRASIADGYVFCGSSLCLKKGCRHAMKIRWTRMNKTGPRIKPDLTADGAPPMAEGKILAEVGL